MTRKVATMALAVLLLGVTERLGAQNTYNEEGDLAYPTLTKSRAEKLVPRPAFAPVKSMEKTAKCLTAIDTIDTTDPSRKIIIYEDHSWEYWKDGNYIKNEEIFTSNWDNFHANPYGTTFDDLPYKVNLWLVDSTDRYHYPSSEAPVVTSKFGRRRYRWHRGIDLRTPSGKPVYASFDGKVRIAKYIKGYGNLVVLRHECGLESFYAHLSRLDVKEGDWVECGNMLGLSGSTGRSSGPHLHFEIRYMGFAIDPEWMIDFTTGELRHRVLVIKKKYMDPAARYVPENDEEEEEIAKADEEDRLEADRIAREMKAAKYHTIRSGDTLGGIARRYGTTVSAICKLNSGITSKTTLRVGRTLRVK